VDTMNPGDGYWVFVTADGEKYTETALGTAAE
jgi:hypothetical protein